MGFGLRPQLEAEEFGVGSRFYGCCGPYFGPIRMPPSMRIVSALM